MKISLIIALSLSLSAVCATTLDTSSVIFWLTSKLEDIGWRKGCLTTAGCAQPRFQMVLLNAITNERLSKSWLIVPKLMQERQRMYVTHWSDGNASDIQISCEVIGVDPTYGFPRVCDSSTSVNIYQNKEKQEERLGERSGTITSSDSDDKIIVKLTARCFNSTIIIEKYEKRCPWCIEYSDDTIINQQYPEDLKSSFAEFVGNESYLNVLLTAFALTAALSSAFCAFIIYLYVRQKKSRDLSSSGKCQSCSTTHIMHIESSNGSAESTRYDIPWDRTYRPLPRWTSSRSNSSDASPPDTSSTFTTSSQHLKPTKVIVGSVLRQIDSPNAPIYERPEAGGLRCV
ncbi:unnamed protein product [Litomosoides sigmodontis]|uniref:C2 domain-containing protein n=1 Tax=Litomosoides sigmodontis TaxID=42156 RepID=A0A3P7JKE3_LITSI|nr:unnamed protein product [Litomosoides sigmodontis]